MFRHLILALGVLILGLGCNFFARPAVEPTGDVSRAAAPGLTEPTPVPLKPPTATVSQTATPAPTTTYPFGDMTPSIPSPTPVPTLSLYAQQAVQYFSETDHLQLRTETELTNLRQLSPEAAQPFSRLIDVQESERVAWHTGRPYHEVILTTNTGRAHNEIREYFLAIDVETGEVLADDWEDFDQKEKAAYRAKYGKFRPRLYDHLQTIADDTLVSVEIWLSGTKGEVEIYRELGHHFPEVATPAAQGEDPRDLLTIILALGKDPFNPANLDDPALADLKKRIVDKYREIWYADTQARMAPVKEWLEREGYAYHSFEPMPALDAKHLPKEAIYRLVEVEAVRTMDFIPEPTPTPPIVIYPAQLWPKAQVLAFETLERDEYAGSLWENREPGLRIISSQAEIEAIKHYPYIGPGIAHHLSQVDFQTQVALLAFRGWTGTVYDGFQVKQVLRLADEVILVAQKWYPTAALGEYVDAESSPYHLITVPKDGTWSGQLVFKLYFEVEPEPVAVVSHSFE